MKTKYNNIIFSSFLATLVLLLMVSCNAGEQEDYTGLATVSASSPDITITADFDPINGIEKDATYPFTLTLTEPQIADIKVEVFQSGGTAVEGEDFTIDTHTIIIPANSLSATGSITIIADADPEEPETISITIGDEKLANTIFTPVTYNFTLENFESEILDISFEWGVDVIFDGDAYSAGDYIDLDVFVSDAAGFDINDPWATFNDTDYAATGDHPEVLHMNKADWGDGEYILWHELWSNQYYGLWDERTVPITTTFVRAGVFKETIVQDDSQAMVSTDLGEAEDGTNTHGFIAKVTIAGDTYTITAENGDEIISGKMENGKMKTPRPDYLKK